MGINRQATQEPSQDCARDGQGEGGGIEGQEKVEGTGYVLIGPRTEEYGVACLYVPTSCSRISWRIGNTRFSSYLLIDGSGCKKDFCIFIHLSKESSENNNEVPPSTLKASSFY